MSKFPFGPEKFPGLSRNGPLDSSQSKLYSGFHTADSGFQVQDLGFLVS